MSHYLASSAPPNEGVTNLTNGLQDGNITEKSDGYSNNSKGDRYLTAPQTPAKPTGGISKDACTHLVTNLPGNRIRTMVIEMSVTRSIPRISKRTAHSRIEDRKVRPVPRLMNSSSIKHESDNSDYSRTTDDNRHINTLDMDHRMMTPVKSEPINAYEMHRLPKKKFPPTPIGGKSCLLTAPEIKKEVKNIEYEDIKTELSTVRVKRVKTCQRDKSTTKIVPMSETFSAETKIHIQ